MVDGGVVEVHLFSDQSEQPHELAEVDVVFEAVEDERERLPANEAVDDRVVVEELEDAFHREVVVFGLQVGRVVCSVAFELLRLGFVGEDLLAHGVVVAVEDEDSEEVVLEVLQFEFPRGEQVLLFALFGERELLDVFSQSVKHFKECEFLVVVLREADSGFVFSDGGFVHVEDWLLVVYHGLVDLLLFDRDGFVGEDEEPEEVVDLVEVERVELCVAVLDWSEDGYHRDSRTGRPAGTP